MDTDGRVWCSSIESEFSSSRSITYAKDVNCQVLFQMIRVRVRVRVKVRGRDHVGTFESLEKVSPAEDANDSMMALYGA